MMSMMKVALVAGAVALPSVAMAAKLPPGSCAFEKKGVAANTICSYSCDPKTMWCSQQVCANGTLVHVIPCYGSFCTAKCG
jgi:hypothetical protein